MTVLVDDSIASKDKVLRTLAEPASAIDITGYGTCTLLRKQTLEISVLAYQLIRRGEIEHQIGTCQGEMITYRCGSPYVLTNLNTEPYILIRAEYLRGRSHRPARRRTTASRKTRCN